MAVQDPKLTPKATKKKKRNIKAASAELEGFLEWVDSIASDPAEERENDMFSLAAGFTVWMSKQAVSAQGETTPGSKVSGKKRSRQSGPDEVAQKSPTVIIVDSPERAPNALPALEGSA